MSRFLLVLLSIAVASFGGYQLIGNVLPAKYFFAQHAFIPALFCVITALYHAGLMRSHAKSPKDSIRYYMGATGLKLFLFLIIILIYAFLHKTEAVAFALCFFFYYIVFTVYEVSVSYRLFSGAPKG